MLDQFCPRNSRICIIHIHFDILRRMDHFLVLKTYILLMFSTLVRGQSTCNPSDKMGVNIASTMNLNDGIAGRQFLASSYTSTCCGPLTEWSFNAGNTGTLYLQVWRGDGSGTYTLVGQNTFSVTVTSTTITESVPSSDQIIVATGDFLGWYSDDPEIISYSSSSGSGQYETTNSVPAVGGSLTTLSGSYSSTKYAVRASLETGNSPSFSNLPATATLSCGGATVGDVVFTVTATDADTNDSLNVTLDSTSPSSHFDFQPSSGIVSVSGSPLTVTSYTLTFTVTDTCGNTATDTLTITVTNNSPTFTNLPSTVSATTSTAVSTVVYTITTSDSDGGTDVLTTTLDSTSPSADFAFTDSNGQVAVSSSLTSGTYTLSFTVTDTCGDTGSGTLTVSVGVGNSAPTITNLPAAVDVLEDVTSLTLLYTLNTYDADGDDVTCSISSTTPAGGPFEMRFVNSGSALLNAVYLQDNANLNYSAVNTYTVQVTCSDNSGSDTQNLYVYITKNGMPTFLNLQNDTTISSTLGVGSTVFTVLAQDNEGDALTFSLTCVSPSTCPFTIYSNGAVLLTSSLTGTSTLAYEVDITASDADSTTAARRLTVLVTGVNTAPELTNLPQTVQISEGISSGTSVFLFSVYDAESDSCDVTLVFSPSSGTSMFSFNSTSKELSLASGQTLDYESVTQYQISVTASDGTTTSNPSNASTLTIDVIDVNEAPVLATSVYYVYQDEGSASTSFGSNPNIDVTDPDSGDNLTYILDTSSNVSSALCGYLQANSNTGYLSYSANYDLEDTSLSSLFSCLIKVEDTGGLSVTATVTVSIQDANDNVPQFSSSSYFMNVNQSTSVGTSLGVISANDADITAANRDLVYSISQTTAYFDLSSTGVVTLKSPVSGVNGGSTLTATLYVQNTGSSSTGSATLQVTVSGGSDDFWDNGVNIAWVTLTIIAVIALIAILTYCLCKHQPWKSALGHKVLRVKPTSRPPRAREDYMDSSPSLSRSTDGDGKWPRTLTPTDIDVHKFEAWSNKQWDL